MNWRQDWDRQQRLEGMSMEEYDRAVELDRLFSELQQGEADYEARTGSLTAAPAFNLRNYITQGWNRRMGPESTARLFGDGTRMGITDFLPGMGLVDGIDAAVDTASNGLTGGNAMDMGFGALDAAGLGWLARGAGRGMRALDARPADGLYDMTNNPMNRQYFVDRMREAQDSHGPIGRSVSVNDPDGYAGQTMLMSDDGMAGLAVSADGEANTLVKHRNSPMRGFGTAAAQRAADEGATWLNAFDTVLPGMYGRAGFSPVSRIGFSEDVARGDWGDEATDAFMSANQRFNEGRPDLVFMRQTGSPQTVANGVGGANYGSDYGGAYDAVRSAVQSQAPDQVGYENLKQYIQSQLGR